MSLVKPMPRWLFSAAVVLLAALLLLLAPGVRADEDAAAPEPGIDDTEIASTAPEESADTGSDDDAASEDSAEESPKKKWYRGSLRVGFDGIWASGGDRDIELDQYLTFRIDPPKHERLHLQGAIWLIEKLDPPSSRYSGLRDLNDTFNERVLARVSSLYLDVDDLWGDSVLRIGRQRIFEGAAYNRIDGLYFKQRQQQWDWYVFGGTRATFYGDNFDDPVFGGGVSVTPTGRTKIALDTYLGRERQYTGRRYALHGPVATLYYRLTSRRPPRTVESASVSLSVWHTVNENLSLFGRVNWYDDRGEELLLSASGHAPGKLDLTYEVTYRRQFNSIGDRTSDISGYYRLMGVYEGYDNLFMAVHRPVTEKLMVSLETELHWTRSSNWANRDYQRYAAYLMGQKLFGSAELDAKIGLERWSVSRGADSWAVVGEVARRWERLQVALGADYLRYKDRVTEYNETITLLDMARVWFAPGSLQGYNPLVLVYGKYTVQMQENIYTFYLKGRWTIDSDQDLSAKITLETGDRPNTPVWRFQADYTYRF